MKPTDSTLISRLIFRRIIGTITTEGSARLEEWRKASPSNEETYQRLLDSAFLEREYRRMKAVDIQRPLADMQARIGRKHPGLWIKAGIAAAMLGLVIWGITYLRTPVLDSENISTESVPYASQIRAGETKAVLTTSNGAQISLGADSEQNEEAMQAGQRQQEKRTSTTAAARLNCLTTPRGGEFRITLEDGTQVWLNAESQLSYPDTFRNDERRVILKGEAYFQVAKNEEKPFYVESDGQLVRVYGTEFNVRSYQEDPEIYTTLVSGSVALQPSRGNSGELFLTPGHQAVFVKSDSSAYVRTVNTEVVTSWRNGKFVFEEQNLGQIMCTLSRWYDFEYEFTDNVLSETVFMGSVPRYGDFNEVLQILEKSGGLKFRVNNRTVTVSAR